MDGNFREGKGLEEIVQGYDITNVVGNVFYVILIFIVFDVITGLLASAKERKINSSISFEGILYKIAELVALAFVSFIDIYFQMNGVITKIGVGLLIAYEGISIVENFSRVGLDMKFLTQYFDKDKVGRDDDVI